VNTQARQLVKSAILAAKTMDPSLELSLQDVLYLCKGKPPQHKIDKEPPLLLTVTAYTSCKNENSVTSRCR